MNAAPSPHDFDAFRENLGMLSMAVVVLVFWLLYRRMVELSRLRSARTTGWKDSLRRGGVTEEFLLALDHFHSVPPETLWPWLPSALLGKGNGGVYAMDVARFRTALPQATELVPVYVEGAEDVFVVMVDHSRFVRVSGSALLETFEDFQAVLQHLLQRARAAGANETQCRRLGEAMGFRQLEAWLTKSAA